MEILHQNANGGRVRHISVPEKTLVMEDGTVIGLDMRKMKNGRGFIVKSGG